jgi:hypothetical protein
VLPSPVPPPLLLLPLGDAAAAPRRVARSRSAALVVPLPVGPAARASVAVTIAVAVVPVPVNPPVVASPVAAAIPAVAASVIAAAAATRDLTVLRARLELAHRLDTAPARRRRGRNLSLRTSDLFTRRRESERADVRRLRSDLGRQQLLGRLGRRRLSLRLQSGAYNRPF